MRQIDEVTNKRIPPQIVHMAHELMNLASRITELFLSCVQHPPNYYENISVKTEQYLVRFHLILEFNENAVYFSRTLHVHHLICLGATLISFTYMSRKLTTVIETECLKSDFASISQKNVLHK